MPIDVSSLDEATRGHITALGLHEMEPAAALGALTAKWREAETKLGGPADELFRIPANADAAALAPVYEKLGAPKDAAGYEFKDVQAPDALKDRVRAYAAAHRLTQPQANALLMEQVTAQSNVDKARLEGTMTAATLAKQSLDSAWGSEAGLRQFQASKAMEHFDFKADDLQLLAGTDAQKYIDLMQKFSALGARMQEAKILGDGGHTGGSLGAVTPDQARAKIEALKADQAFTARRLHDDAATRMTAANELMDLERIARGMPIR